MHNHNSKWHENDLFRSAPNLQFRSQLCGSEARYTFGVQGICQTGAEWCFRTHKDQGHFFLLRLRRIESWYLTWYLPSEVKWWKGVCWKANRTAFLEGWSSISTCPSLEAPWALLCCSSEGRDIAVTNGQVGHPLLSTGRHVLAPKLWPKTLTIEGERRKGQKKSRKHMKTQGHSWRLAIYHQKSTKTSRLKWDAKHLWRKMSAFKLALMKLSGILSGLWHSSRAVPPLPGAQKTCRTLGDSLNFTAMACSRPPPPTTKTSMAAKRLETTRRCFETHGNWQSKCKHKILPQQLQLGKNLSEENMFLNPPPQETCSKECPTSSQPRQWCFPGHVQSQSHPPAIPAAELMKLMNREITLWMWKLTFNTTWQVMIQYDDMIRYMRWYIIWEMIWCMMWC